MLYILYVLLRDESGLLHSRQGWGEGSRGGCLWSPSWAVQGQMLQQGACHGTREPAMAAGLEAPEQGREGRDAARPQRWWKERGSLRERHCVKFLAIRRPLKVAGLWATLKERPTLKNRGLRMWGGKDLFTRLFVLICFRCSWLRFPWLQHWLYSSLPFSELEL